MSETYTPPKSAINNAKRGLDLRKKYGRGGLTPAEAKSYGIDSGITRAKRISKGKLSRHDVRRMSAFNRHRQNYNPSKKMADGGPTAGTIAWLLWGGTSGVNWAKKKSAAMGAESFEAESIKLVWSSEDEEYDYSCLLTLKFQGASPNYPVYKKLSDGDFALDPNTIVKVKEFILSGLNLRGVDYSESTITSDSIIFKFNFMILEEAKEFSKYLIQYISRTFAIPHDKIPSGEVCPHCLFSLVNIEVLDKYEVGIKFSQLMDWSNKELVIDFFEFLVALQPAEYQESLNILKRRGDNIEVKDDVGLSIKDLLIAEKQGYVEMFQYIINEMKNKNRELDIVAFTINADNGMKNLIMKSQNEIKRMEQQGLINKTLARQFFFNEGKLQAIGDFLYYVFNDSDNFIFDNI